MPTLKIIAVLLFAGLTQCGPGQQAAEEQSHSMLHYIPFSTTNGISLRHARASVFNICTRGATNADVEQRSIQAVLTWLKAVRKVDDKVTNKVAISCSNPHLNINMISGTGVSYASPGNANYYTGQAVGELIHELGHALAGLSDTFVGCQAGACKDGHSQSNMCWGAYGPRANTEKFSALWSDDIAGVSAQHKKLFPDAVPPVNADSIDAEAPLNMANPWPTSGTPGGATPVTAGNRIYAALSNSTTNSATLLMSAALGTQRILVCSGISDVTLCATSPSRIELQNQAIQGDRVIFSSPTAFTVAETPIIYSFAVDATNTLTSKQAFKFKSIP